VIILRFTQSTQLCFDFSIDNTHTNNQPIHKCPAHQRGLGNAQHGHIAYPGNRPVHSVSLFPHTGGPALNFSLGRHSLSHTPPIYICMCVNIIVCGCLLDSHTCRPSQLPCPTHKRGLGASQHGHIACPSTRPVHSVSLFPHTGGPALNFSLGRHSLSHTPPIYMYVCKHNSLRLPARRPHAQAGPDWGTPSTDTS
jgi:hypothetical protein